MQDQELINKVITVSGKEEKMQGGKPVMKIKDQDNLTYTVYKTKQDGTESAAWKQMPSLEEVVQIGFVEQKGEYEGKPVTYRTIRVFNKDIGKGVANAQTPRQERFNNPLYDKPKEEFKPRNFEQEAYEKCQSLWAAHELGAGVSPDKIVSLHINGGHYWELFQAIKAEGKKRFFEFDKPGSKPGTVTKEMVQVDEPLPEELPTIQVEDTDVSDIPF